MRTSFSRLENFLGVNEIVNQPVKLLRALAAEYVATTMLLIVGMGSGLQDTEGLIPNAIQSAFGGGLTLIAAIQISIHVSGAHLNPAITLPFVLVGQIKILKAILYIVVQITAGVTAAALLKAFLPDHIVGDLQLKPPAALENYQVFGIECIATIVLVFAVCTLADKRSVPVRGVEPILIGLVVVSIHLFALKFSGCGLNPARIIGPIILHPGSSNWDSVWIYCLAELCGGILAAVFYFLVLYERPLDVHDVEIRPRIHSMFHDLKLVSSRRATVGPSHQS